MSTRGEGGRSAPTWLVVALLITACLLVFGRTLAFDFVDYDDGPYVERNPAVLAGLTHESLAWALRTPHMGLWAPLTWISYMLEVELFGASPAAMHATNVALHTLNTVLLFLLVRRVSGATWRSALVAVLFAVHPLHVEPVAWIASRKDVLSTTLGWLALLAYVAYVRRREEAGGGRYAYAAAALWLALGLAAKPMLVTFPLLFVAIDLWITAQGGAAEPAWARLRRALRRAAPCCALSAAGATVAWWAQSSAATLASADALELAPRLTNALASCFAYLERTLWPTGLCVLYPHPYIEGAGGTPPTDARLALAAGTLAGVSLWAASARAPAWLRFGWSWYLLTLLPVLGFVQLGRQAMADRFTYVPLVGVFLALAFAAGALVERRPRWRVPLASAATLWVLLLAGLAWRQSEHWRDAVSLYERALETNPDNATMHYNLGYVRLTRAEPELALTHFERAIELQPAYGRAHYNRALLLHARGELEGAISGYRTAIDLLDGELRELARSGLSRATVDWAAARR